MKNLVAVLFGEQIPLIPTTLIAMDMEHTLQALLEGHFTALQKKTTLIAVKVLNCQGSGSYAGVISGVQWVATSAGNRKRPSVANMSLGGGFNQAMNDAVDAAVAAGVVFVVAGGNDNADACNYSPASARAVVTAGATALQANGNLQVDGRSYFSNFGTCINIFAPGSAIKSAYIRSNTDTASLSGTSMASPHVCGSAALYLQTHPAAKAPEVLQFLEATSGKGLILMECAKPGCDNSPNYMLHSDCA